LMHIMFLLLPSSGRVTSLLQSDSNTKVIGCSYSSYKVLLIMTFYSAVLSWLREATEFWVKPTWWKDLSNFSISCTFWSLMFFLFCSWPLLLMCRGFSEDLTLAKGK
jgi:hypothetical protein